MVHLSVHDIVGIWTLSKVIRHSLNLGNAIGSELSRGHTQVHHHLGVKLSGDRLDPSRPLEELTLGLTLDGTFYSVFTK